MPSSAWRDHDKSSQEQAKLASGLGSGKVNAKHLVNMELTLGRKPAIEQVARGQIKGGKDGRVFYNAGIFLYLIYGELLFIILLLWRIKNYIRDLLKRK